MTQPISFILTDTHTDAYVDTFDLTSDDQPGFSSTPWSIRKHRLHGGISAGVDLVDIKVGLLKVSICPTRGMGIWKGSLAGELLGWNSPVRGPVHPSFIQRDELGGIGWLAGFDEWIVRCGLNNNGAPATDRLLDNTGAEQTMSLPLHGRIANIPAHHVRIELRLEPTPSINVIGIVDEAMLFFPQLRLETRIEFPLGSTKFVIHDRVTNLRSQPAELELLYHTNFGPPLLEEGSRFVAPVERLAAINAHSQKGLDGWNEFPAPIPGVIEECFVMKLLAHRNDQRSLAMLQNRSRDKACLLRFSLEQLPWFTLWKNPAALSDGYVTGLEPGTDLPNAKPFERANGRVIKLPPGAHYDIDLAVEVTNQKEQIADWEREIAKVQSTRPPRVEADRPIDLTPG